MTDFALRFSRILAFLLLVSVCRAGMPTPEAGATLVLFNSSYPDAPGLAEYYASKRNIPAAQVIGLPMPVAEEISRAEFDAQIAEPLRQALVAAGFWKLGSLPDGSRGVVDSRIRFLAIIRGVPLKIAPDPSIPPATNEPNLPPEITTRNDASVDSELTLLGITGTGVAGFVSNPYFGRLTPVMRNALPAGMLLPSRLDAPTPDAVRAMIDDSLMAEREGLWGWGYVDARGITEGGLAQGDQWLANVVQAMRAQGVPVVYDNLPPTFPDGFPMGQAAAYFGWYAGDACGPFANTTFRFVPGAVAVHIHSFSAASLRTLTGFWCGPLVLRGAAATLGNVYEPYLSFTAYLDVFESRLMDGFTLAESGWMAQPVLSWMSVVVGDPLYRPYAAWRNPQPQALNVWDRYRRIIRRNGGDVLAAASDLQAAAQAAKSSVFLESLGIVQSEAGMSSEAITSFDAALALSPDPITATRITLELNSARQAIGEAPLAVPGISPAPSPAPSPTPSPTASASPAPSIPKPTPPLPPPVPVLPP